MCVCVCVSVAHTETQQENIKEIDDNILTPKQPGSLLPLLTPLTQDERAAYI